MRNLRPGDVLPRFDVICYDQMHKMPHEQSHLPIWNREELIQQFRGIDAATRSEAEKEVDALEQSFRDVLAVSRASKGR